MGDAVLKKGSQEPWALGAKDYWPALLSTNQFLARKAPGTIQSRRRGISTINAEIDPCSAES